jgi:hypothetical protein
MVLLFTRCSLGPVSWLYKLGGGGALYIVSAPLVLICGDSARHCSSREVFSYAQRCTFGRLWAFPVGPVIVVDAGYEANAERLSVFNIFCNLSVFIFKFAKFFVSYFFLFVLPFILLKNLVCGAVNLLICVWPMLKSLLVTVLWTGSVM